MNARASVTTARAPAAIAAIRLEGPDAAAILEDVFPAPNGLPRSLKPGDIAVGDLVDGAATIDNVVVACLCKQTFDINCHGNPLITTAVMRVLQDRDAELVAIDRMLYERFRPHCNNTIQLEARLQQLTAATLPGVKLIAAQACTGLAAAAKKWLADIQTQPLESIQRQAAEALRRARIAKPLIYGCKIVLAGPPNSGKSTLLNALTGRPQAITADVPGTTRDYVTASCRIGPLAVQFIDTAGLDPTLTAEPADRAAQTAAKELLNDCDLVLHVIDAPRPGTIQPLPTPTPVIVVLNKSDLPPRITPQDLPFQPAATVALSALHAKGLETLTKAIETALNPGSLEPTAPIPFTTRQTTLLTQLTTASDKSHARSLITQLLTAPLPS